MIIEKIKLIIEENPVALATVNEDGSPRVIVVAYVKVKDGKVIITANYMKSTLENIKRDSRVSLGVWNNKMEGYRIDGLAEFFDNGEWYDFVTSMEENKEEPCLGALVVSIKEVVKLA